MGSFGETMPFSRLFRDGKRNPDVIPETLTIRKLP
jgi:hypothetical protein